VLLLILPSAKESGRRKGADIGALTGAYGGARYEYVRHRQGELRHNFIIRIPSRIMGGKEGEKDPSRTHHTKDNLWMKPER